MLSMIMGLIILLLSFSLYYILSWSPKDSSGFYSNKPLFFGHRGALLHEPENTLPSYKKAIKMGLHALELDVVSTKDGVVLCSHNFDLERETDGFGYIHEQKFNDLNSTNIAIKWNNRTEHFSTLETVIDSLPNDIRLNIEIKTSKWNDISTAIKVAKMIKQKNIIHRTIVSSFNPMALWIVKRIDKTILTGFVIEYQKLFPLVRFVQPDCIHPEGSLVTEDLIRFARKRGMAINVWTINTKPAIDWLVQKEVDGIITDRAEFATDGVEFSMKNNEKR